MNTNSQTPDPDVLRALIVLCVAIAVDLEEMHANGAIDFEEWPNAKALVDAVNTKLPHAFNHLSESFDKPHDHLCACNMDDEPICNRSCIYCSCWRIESARAEGEKRGKNLTVNWPQAYEDAVEDCISALEFMDKHPHGLIDAAAAIAFLRTIVDGVTP